ncbi:MAG: amidohydrolase family protein [Kiritimatiellae bacterium]|nr:amidohydrolase family protein [Kiritimatiellia bacterium]
MIIDIHAHITYGNFKIFSRLLGRKPFTVEILLKRMNSEGIDKSVLLPLINAEVLDYYGVAGNQECIEATRKYPDRLMTFCGIDPRSMMNYKKGGLSKLLAVYKKLGCIGIGEMCASIPITHRLYQNLLYVAGEENLPILFHFVSKTGLSYGAVDKLNLPGLEKMLGKFPKTIFIGHSPCFWNEIASVTDKERIGYVKGAIKKEGKLWRFMKNYPNLYGDISAGSGYIALSRDSAKCCKFIEKFSDRLFFGTDRFTSVDEAVPPQIGFLKESLKNKMISKTAYENITHNNFERTFHLG